MLIIQIVLILDTLWEKCFRRRKIGMGKLNVAIADDNERMLGLLGDIIRSDEECEVVGTAKDGEEACK